VSTSFSRLREVFRDDQEPLQALFCTYGLDTDFFEAEVLPQVFPQRLALDREAGSATGYLNAADRTLQSVPITVFYDHLVADGNQLQYLAQRVAVNGAFHAKLILLDYGDHIRAVISSANITRPAWTQLLELFLVADIRTEAPHAWAPGLSRFVTRLATEVPVERRTEIEQLAGRLSTQAPDGLRSTVVSSWEGPLLPRMLEGMADLSGVDLITPFLEGEDGKGVFDTFERFAPKGRLFLAASEVGERYLVRGPETKIDALLATGRWQLMRVHQQWTGDDEEASLRSLHGKALVLKDGKRTRVVVGSANVTRAALQVPPPNGNVEIVVVLDDDTAAARRVLPQASRVSRDAVDIEAPSDPSGEDDVHDAGAERWVDAAVYWAGRGELEIRTVTGAPSLDVRYDGVLVGTTKAAQTIVSLLRLGGPLFIEVDDGEQAGIVPLVIADPERFVPRGTPTDIDLEAFCLLLAGARDIEPVPGDLHPTDQTPGNGVDEGVIGRTGAIPWRRLLAAMKGIGAELLREAPFPRGVAFVLENETRVGGLRRRLHAAHERRRLMPADYAYSLHELLRVLAQAEEALGEEPESRELVAAAADMLRGDIAAVTAEFDGAVARQLRILSREVAR
jgi:hypothetical protein